MNRAQLVVDDADEDAARLIWKSSTARPLQLILEAFVPAHLPTHQLLPARRGRGDAFDHDPASGVVEGPNADLGLVACGA